MTTVYDHYSEELAQAHREALAVLRELLATETDPTERRRLAIAILHARPIKPPHPPAAEPHPLPGEVAPRAIDAPGPVQTAAAVRAVAHVSAAPLPLANPPGTLRAGTPRQRQKPRHDPPGGGSSAAA